MFYRRHIGATVAHPREITVAAAILANENSGEIAQIVGGSGADYHKKAFTEKNKVVKLAMSNSCRLNNNAELKD
ncbi:hypothetical protein [Erwinia sp. HR93]|uniref:hypothetical protein n=1 Tax=Erwinia sp. HR93 TaxID=3094840 RepID=UPI002ADEDD1A|nr:hypothetical protein [Erwinia sp. HR93]MEA1065657.1 hypothetical protein [Erwinia sp. HR93]